ncbi:MAG: hypothetical protein GXP16_18010 [Gammaproteobacteria bacterium]|nr:hypothetical protein [Gammaproteobacteria bacterium]
MTFGMTFGIKIAVIALCLSFASTSFAAEAPDGQSWRDYVRHEFRTDMTRSERRAVRRAASQARRAAWRERRLNRYADRGGNNREVLAVPELDGSMAFLSLGLMAGFVALYKEKRRTTA